jgi:hypothetical protein
MIVFAVTFCHPVQPLADHGEHHRPDRQAQCRSPNASFLVGVLEHLKGEGRDECSGGERKHARQHPLWELQSPTGQGTQHQGARSDHAEQNRLSHAS